MKNLKSGIFFVAVLVGFAVAASGCKGNGRAVKNVDTLSQCASEVLYPIAAFNNMRYLDSMCVAPATPTRSQLVKTTSQSGDVSQIVYTNGTDSIVYGQTRLNTFLWGFHLRSREWVAGDSMYRTGTPKSVLLDRLHLETTAKVLFLFDELGGNDITFTFSNDTLTDVKFFADFDGVN